MGAAWSWRSSVGLKTWALTYQGVWWQDDLHLGFVVGVSWEIDRTNHASWTNLMLSLCIWLVKMSSKLVAAGEMC